MRCDALARPPARGGGPAPPPPAPPLPLCLRFRADPLAVRAALGDAQRAMQAAGLSPGDRGTAEIVLAEALNNVVEHAYGDAGGEIWLHLDRGMARLSCRIEDRGASMPALTLPEGRLPESCARDLPEGGFGWHLIRTLSRNLAYDRLDGRNCLSFDVPLEQ